MNSVVNPITSGGSGTTTSNAGGTTRGTGVCGPMTTPTPLPAGAEIPVNPDGSCVPRHEPSISGKVCFLGGVPQAADGSCPSGYFHILGPITRLQANGLVQ